MMGFAALDPSYGPLRASLHPPNPPLHRVNPPGTAFDEVMTYEIDINGLIILGLGKLGLVHDIFSARSRTLEHARANDETGGAG